MKKKLFFLVVLLVTMVAGAWGAGFTRTLTGNLEVTGYELKAFYDFQTNTPAVLPTEGDLRYRDGNVWGLHNFASGQRTAEVQIPVSEGNLLILQEYVDETNGITGFNATINCGTANDELSTSTGYHVFDITSNATTINITVPRYGGVVAALVMKVTGSEEAELPNLDDYDLVKSVTWDGGTDLTRATDALTLQTYNSENKVMSAVFPLTAPEEAAGWIAVQGTKSQDGKGWWNRSEGAEKIGLWSYNATRCAAVYGDDLTTGWLIVFECTQDPAAVMTLTNKDGMPDGTFTYVKDVKNYYCTINAASNAYVGFCGIKSVGYISKISVYKPKSAVVEDAEITKVELQGNFATTGTEWNAVSLTGQSDNVYSGVLDLTGYTDDKSFKLVVNDGGSDSDGYAGWIGTNNVTVDAPEGWVVSTGETDNGNLTLNNSKTGYQTYTVTATWQPNVDYYKGWSLKIEGKDARKYAVSVADGITNGTVTVDKTEAAEGEEVTVTATPADGYELDAITVTGKTSNQAVTVTEGKFTMIADAVTVSATFKESEGGTTETGWLLTAPDKLATGDIVVIVDQTSSKAMSNDKGTTAAPAAESVTLSEDKSSITDNTVPANIQWVVTVSEEGTYQFNVKGTENYLYVTATNNGVRVGAGDRNAYSIVTGGDNGGYYLYNSFIKEDQSKDERYVGCYNEADWRCYTSINGNIKGNNNAFYKKYGEDAVAAPVIEGETPFVGSTTVTITCETQDASIYYTTDGADPTNESTAYTEPFELKASATVKAIAYDVTGANSEIASKEFVATPSAATVAELNALADKTEFVYTGEALIVAKATITSTNASKNYVYIKDESGSSLIYDADASKTADAAVGKTLAANWKGKVTVYKNLFEAVPDAALAVKDGDPVEVTYPEAQLSDIKADNINQVVELKGVTYAIDGKKLTISIGQENTEAGYNQFGLEISAVEEGKSYNIVGAIGRYNDNIQFWPISIEEAQTETAPLYVIGDMNGWSRTAMIEMEFNAETQAYEYSFTNENEFATFAFATYQMTEEEAQADQYWSTFNAEYRWDIGAGDVDATDYVNGDAVQLVKGVDGTVKLPKGTYTVIVNPETMMMTITGTIAPKPTLQYDAVYVAGNTVEGNISWMNGIAWDPLAEANKMTKVEGMDDVWEITFKDVTAYEGYAFKFVVSGEWTQEQPWNVNFGGDFLGYGIETPAVYNANNNIVFNTTAEKQDITLRIDLSDYDPQTLGGATFTVIAPKEQNTYVVAGCVGEKEGGADDELFGKAWDGTAEANQLAYDATSKLYTKTYEAVTFEAQTQVKFKIVINGKLWVPAEDQICEIPAAGTYDITVTYNAETGEATMTATLTPVDIVINPEDITGGDITAAIAAKTEGKNVKNITINLAEGGAYTVTASIEGFASVTINGNGATIDASGLGDSDKGFINYSDVIGEFAMKDETTASAYIIVDNVTIKDVTINGLGKSVINNASGKKTLFKSILVDNSVIEIVGNNNVFALGTAYPEELKIEKSTIWSKEGHKGFFFKADGKPADVNASETTTWTVNQSNLYNIAVGKKANNSNGGIKGKKTTTMVLTNSILYNFGSSKGNEVNGWLWGQNGGVNSVYANNTYWSADGEVAGWTDATKGGSDQTGTQLTTDPGFRDAANGDFALASPSAQAQVEGGQTGDPRWGVWNANTITIADDIKHGTVKADMTYAGQGTVVTVTATPDENYKLERMTVEGEGVDLAIDVTMDDENPNVGTFTMPAGPVIVRAEFKYVIPAGTHILNINDIYAAAQAKTAPCENATVNSGTKYNLNEATIEMDIFTIVSKSDRTYRIDASTNVDYGDYESWSRLEPNGASNSTGGRQMFVDVPEGGGVLYIGAHGNAGRALYVTKAADKTSFVNLTNVAEADVMLTHAFVDGETSPADYNVYKVQLEAGLYCITQKEGIYFTYVKFVEGETYTAPAIDVDALKAEIAAAKTLLGKADITVDPGKALNTAIETATTALKSVNAETTQETVNQAVTDLQAAEAAFKLVVAKGKLTDEIATATELLGEASTEADTPGAALKKAIDDAQAVLDSTESTLEEVNKATEDLKTAEEAYKTATSINGIDASKFADGAWYTTGGVRVDKPTKKGLYIHNGRKVVIK